MRALIIVAYIISNCLTVKGLSRIVCIYSHTAAYRSALGLLNPEDIDVNLCTHLIYSYATIEDFEVKPTNWHDEDTPWMKGMYNRFYQLKHDNSGLKLLLALGPVSGGSKILFNAMKNETVKNNFTDNVVKFIRRIHFDGVHLEWSQLATDRSHLDDIMQFLELVKALREAFDDAWMEVNSSVILTVSLPAKKTIDDGSMIRELISCVDFVTLLTFDMRTAGDKKVGLSSPVCSDKRATGDDRYLSVDWVATHYESLGVAPAKINIGIPTFGRTFRLANRTKNQIGDAAVGPGKAGKWTYTPGILAFYEMCTMIRDSGQIVNVASQQGRYYVNRDQWISYDDIYSIMQKVCYMKRKGIGGLTFWTLDLDDFTGHGCHQGKFPLITTAVNTLVNADLSLCAPIDRHIYVEVPTLPNPVTTVIPDKLDEPKGKRIVCYFTNWAHYRHDRGKFLPEDIDPHICTHIVYAYAWIIKNVISPIRLDEDSENWREGMYHRVVQMKKTNPRLKVLLAVGGYSAGSAGFENVSKTSESRKAFSADAVVFLNERKFDGLEVDWQHVTADFKLNNLLLLQALWNAFDQNARASGTRRLLLTAALPSSKKHIDEGYKDAMDSLIKFTDFVSILTYDFHGNWDIDTNFHSPLFALPGQSGENRYRNVDWVVKYYVSLGVPRDFINVGIATYGRSFTLSHARHHFLGASVMRTGEPGSYTNRPGILAYYEICDLVASGGTVVRAPTQRAVYMYKDYLWVGYDDVDTVSEKACYVVGEGYGGVLIWSLDYDDFTGDSCNEGKFPLTTIAHTILHNSDMKVCHSIHDSRSVSGNCIRRHDRTLFYMSLLMIRLTSDLVRE